MIVRVFLVLFVAGLNLSRNEFTGHRNLNISIFLCVILSLSTYHCFNIAVYLFFSLFFSSFSRPSFISIQRISKGEGNFDIVVSHAKSAEGWNFLKSWPSQMHFQTTFFKGLLFQWAKTPSWSVARGGAKKGGRETVAPPLCPLSSHTWPHYSIIF